MTDAAHASGTDRIAEVARLQGWGAAEIVVNVQGDEPLLPESLIDQVAATLANQPEAQLATLSVPLGSPEELQDPNVVKVVSDLRQRALYFSRAPIPWDRNAGVAGAGRIARRHLGIYAYRVGALLQLASLSPTPLERLEKLEQLRALEHGMDIRVVEAVAIPGGDVNAAGDVARVEALLATERFRL
jgi:3-deoxy-manno-octulosonate cytidylyltransferase (CMP-KDO synthetase)